MPVITEIEAPAADSGANGDEEPCGVENCHGLEIVCGSNVPAACTEIYMFGDGCRRYAKCAVTGGQCVFVPNSDFDACKACVEKCAADFARDIIDAFSCESACVNRPTT